MKKIRVLFCRFNKEQTKMTDKYTLEKVDFNPFAGNEIEKVVLTNESQRELWLSCILGGDEASLAYNESVSLQLTGVFFINSFQRAIQDLIKRHEALRAVISPNGEDLIIYKDMPVELMIHDFTGVNAADIALNDFIQHEIAKPFDLYAGPLFNLYLHQLGKEDNYFTLIIHHLIGDGWSIGIMLEDLGKLYNAHVKLEVPRLQKAEQISEYALEQAEFRNSTEYTSTLNFWLNQYKDDVPVINMPLDFIRPAVRSYRGKRNDYLLHPELLTKLKKLSAQSGASLVATLITSFEIYLYHHTGQQDIVLGLPSAGQSVTGYFGLVGHCVNLLPLKSKISPELSFVDYLKKRKSGIYDAYDHQRLTFSELLQKLNLKRDKSSIPLVPIVFNVDMGMDEKVKFDGLKHHLISNPRVSQTFEISLNVNGSKEAMMFEWAYNTQLFNSSTIDRMMKEFELLLETITSNPEIPISATLVHEEPFPELAVSAVEFPAELTIVDLIKEQAALNPQKKAVVYGTSSITYQELEERANQTANYLLSRGAGAGILIPICLQPSLEMIIGLLGILKSGATYVPVDPEFPKQRKDYIISSCGTTVILTDSDNVKHIEHHADQLDLLVMDDRHSPVWQTSKLPSGMKVSPNELMYIIYTSGSTGTPKGVMIEHRTIVDYLYGLRKVLPQIMECNSFALGSSIATDLGNTVLFSALIQGAELHVFKKDQFNSTLYIHDYFKKNKIDFLKIVPSHWKYLALDERGLFPEKVMMFGGEQLPVDFVNQIIHSGASCLLVNHYGPTETTIGKLLHIIDKEKIYEGTIPIGNVFSNTFMHVVNPYFNHCPVGVAGELYIGGSGLARGYFNNQELTDRFFITNPFDPKNKLYKTGDLVKWLPDGNVQYLGRLDDQIKIRGNRIELGEIQNTLLKHPDVKQCAVVVVDGVSGEKKLAAYVVVKTDTLRKEGIIDFLKTQLPDYMIPRAIVKLDEIPLTANGKVNRKQLPEAENEDHQIHVQPTTRNEQIIASIWKQSLGLKEISITEDFFEMGGHSLKAVKVMTEIEKQTGKRLPISSLFGNSTVKKLAALLQKEETNGRAWDALVPIKTEGKKDPLYLVHGGGLNTLIFKYVSGHMDLEQPVYALQALGLNGSTELLYTIEEIAAKYNSEILEINPTGPYMIGGYSLGGKIAFEMAKQFLAMGKEVKLLAIFDTYTGSSNEGLNRMKLKFTRQIRKIPFILKLFFQHPKQTVFYQLLIARNKFNRLIGKQLDLQDEVFTYDPDIVKSYEIAYKNYRLTPLDIAIDLFRVKERIYYLDDMVYLGWKSYGKKGINVHEIAGDHKTFLYPPNDRELAEILQGVINEKLGVND
jgi:amino acid adenylation domain-containing protein